MHLQYQSVLQARKALSKDGKVFGDWLMVGVKPCIDKVTTLRYATQIPTNSQNSGHFKEYRDSYAVQWQLFYIDVLS